MNKLYNKGVFLQFLVALTFGRVALTTATMHGMSTTMGALTTTTPTTTMGFVRSTFALA